MANNPFYPGYSPKKPDEESINPIFPGYYPGQPVQRKPKSKDFIKPIEYNADAYMEAVDNAARKVLFSPLAGPRWIKDKILDDWKNTLKVSIKPKATAVTSLEDYSTEDLPGAMGMSMSINPFDWLKDPKKQAGKSLNAWTKTVVGLDTVNPLNSDFSDIENTTRKAVWREALGFRDSDREVVKAAGREAEKRTVKPFDGYTNTRPLDLNNINITKGDPRGNQINVYKSLADGISSFEELRQSAQLRDKTFYGSVAKPMADAVDTELYQKLENWRHNPAAVHPTVAAALRDNETKIELFHIKNGFLEDIGNLSWAISGDDSVTEKLSKAVVLKKTDPNKSTLVQDAWSKLDTATRQARNSYNTRMQAIQNLVNAGNVTQEEATKYTRSITKSFDSYLTNLEVAHNQLSTTPLSNSTLDRVKTFSSGGPLGKELGYGNIINSGIQANVSGELVQEIVNGNLNGINTVINDSRLEADGGTIHAKKTIPIAFALKQERLGYATQEFLKGWDEENLLERYAWNNIIEPRIHAYLPATITQKFLDKRQYFGLVVGDDDGRYIPNPNTNPLKYIAFEKRYQYKVGLNFKKIDKVFSDKYGITIARDYFSNRGITKLVVDGGKQFKVLENLKSKNIFDLRNAVHRDLVKGLITGRIDLTDARVARLVSTKMIIGGSVYNKFEGNLINYRAYFLSQKMRNKIGATNLNDEDFQLNLLLALLDKHETLPANFNLAKNFAGRFEKYYVKMSAIKDWFQKNTFIGRGVANYNALKILIKNKFQSFVKELVAKLAVLIPGLQALGPVASEIAKFIVDKAFTYIETFAKAVMKWDFKDLAKLIEKDINKIIKAFLVGCTGCSCIIAIPIFIILMLVAGSISPIDKTIGTSNYDIGSNARNENDIVKIEKSVVVILPNGDKLAPPKDPIPNTVLDNGGVITVQYTVRVTAKVTIEDPGPWVTVEDIGRSINKTGGQPPFLRIQEFEVKPFVEGAVYTYEKNAWTTTISGDKYKDSLIVNTAFAYTPETDDYDADTVESSAIFAIGSPPVSETPGCEGHSLNDSPPENPQANGIAQAAFSIIQQLERGFWCSFNKPSRAMPDEYSKSRSGVFLFNDGKFAEVGAGGDPNGDGDDLFWCTWLIIKSYQSQGFSIGELTGTSSMEGWFREDHSNEASPNNKIFFTSTARNKILATDLKPGDVIFYEPRVYNGRSYGHVGIVYNVTIDNVQIIQSNADSIIDNINVDADGYVAQRNIGGRGIRGFGRVK